MCKNIYNFFGNDQFYFIPLLQTKQLTSSICSIICFGSFVVKSVHKSIRTRFLDSLIFCVSLTRVNQYLLILQDNFLTSEEYNSKNESNIKQGISLGESGKT